MLFSRATSAISSRSRSSHSGTLGSFWYRAAVAVSISVVATVVLALGPAPTRAAAALVGVKSYYLGLGNSLSFGYQPNGDWSDGYVQQWYKNLQGHGSTSLTNYGCLGETSSTFINGGCPYWFLVHNFYLGPQLNAAVDFLNDHAGTVSPVSLDIGANDVLPDINMSTCTVDTTKWGKALQTLDSNLTGTILPQLTKALTNKSGHRTGDLVMMNYYDPFQNICPNSVSYIQQLNQHLAGDAAQFSVHIADVFTSFGGSSVPNKNICAYTWMCSPYHDIHATTKGYGVIAGAFESTTGY